MVVATWWLQPMLAVVFRASEFSVMEKIGVCFEEGDCQGAEPVKDIVWTRFSICRQLFNVFYLVRVCAVHSLPLHEDLRWNLN